MHTYGQYPTFTYITRITNGQDAQAPAQRHESGYSTRLKRDEETVSRIPHTVQRPRDHAPSSSLRCPLDLDKTSVVLDDVCRS